MPRHYFYTDPAILAPQSQGQAFGPVVTGDPEIDPNNDKYRITNYHTSGLTEVPAIAVCDGLICVQPDDAAQGTCTIILKPNYQPPFDFPYIKYYLYKGIKLDSLVIGSALNNNKDIPFIERIKNSWDDPDDTNSYNSNSATVIGKGYLSGVVMHDVEGEPNPLDLFADDQPIDHFFYFPSEEFQLPLVRAGEKIGEFDPRFIGFEIILERLGYEPKISLARTRENYIEVTSILDPHNELDNYHPDDKVYFMHWHDKEQCLNYVDPSAFYGSFCDSKVFYKTGADQRKKCNTPQEIYEDILEGLLGDNFRNRNTVYLDIRNEFGYSLNYFKNLENKIKLVGESILNPVWPIFSFIVNPSIKRKKYQIRLRKYSAQSIDFLIAFSPLNANKPKFITCEDLNTTLDSDLYLEDDVSFYTGGSSLILFALVNVRTPPNNSAFSFLGNNTDHPVFSLPRKNPMNFSEGQLFLASNTYRSAQLSSLNRARVVYQQCLIYQDDAICLINRPYMVNNHIDTKKNRKGINNRPYSKGNALQIYIDTIDSEVFNLVKTTNPSTGGHSYDIDQSSWVDHLNPEKNEPFYEDILAIKKQSVNLIAEGNLGLLKFIQSQQLGDRLTIKYGLYSMVTQGNRVTYSQAKEITISK